MEQYPFPQDLPFFSTSQTAETESPNRPLTYMEELRLYVDDAARQRAEREMPNNPGIAEIDSLPQSWQTTEDLATSPLPVATPSRPAWVVEARKQYLEGKRIAHVMREIKPEQPPDSPATPQPKTMRAPVPMPVRRPPEAEPRKLREFSGAQGKLLGRYAREAYDMAQRAQTAERRQQYLRMGDIALFAALHHDEPAYMEKMSQVKTQALEQMRGTVGAMETNRRSIDRASERFWSATGEEQFYTVGAGKEGYTKAKLKAESKKKHVA